MAFLGSHGRYPVIRLPRQTADRGNSVAPPQVSSFIDLPLKVPFAPKIFNVSGNGLQILGGGPYLPGSNDQRRYRMPPQLWMSLHGFLIAGMVHSHGAGEVAAFFPLHRSQFDHIYYISDEEQRANADCANGHPQMKIDASLAEHIATNADTGRKFPVIIKLQTPDGLSALQERGIQPDLVYQNMPGASANLTADQIRAIENLPQVELIELDQPAWALERHK
jgi:hypothetical protein